MHDGRERCVTLTPLSLHPVRVRRIHEHARIRARTRPPFIAHAHTQTYRCTAPPRIPDVTTLAHLARRTLEMPPPRRPSSLALFLSSSVHFFPSVSSSLTHRPPPPSPTLHLSSSPPSSSRCFSSFPPLPPPRSRRGVHCSVRE